MDEELGKREVNTSSKCLNLDSKKSTLLLKHCVLDPYTAF